MHSRRISDIVELKRSQSIAQFASSMAYSYTLTLYSKRGERDFIPFVYCISKLNLKFYLEYKKGLFKAENIYIITIKSEEMGKEKLKIWLSEVYFPTPEYCIAYHRQFVIIYKS